MYIGPEDFSKKINPSPFGHSLYERENKIVTVRVARRRTGPYETKEPCYFLRTTSRLPRSS